MQALQQLIPTKSQLIGAGTKPLQQVFDKVQLTVLSVDKYKKFQKTYRDDRVAFVYDCMPILRPSFAAYQEEVLAKFDMGVRRQAIRGPHGLGKTLMAAILVHHAMLTVEGDACVPTLASVWRQLEKFLWPEIHKAAKMIDWATVGRDPYSSDEMLTHSIKMQATDKQAFAVSSNDAASIEGAHAAYMFYIFDESKAIEDSMWDAAEGAFSTEGMVMTGSRASECYWFSISTPGLPAGMFYNIHAHKEGLEDWDTRHVRLEEAIAAGRISEEWALKRKHQWGANSAVYKNRVLGEFAADSTEGVIPMEWVEAAMVRFEDWVEAGKPGAGRGERRMGIDTARMGKDKTVFAERVGDRVELLHYYAKQGAPVVAGNLKPFVPKCAKINIEMDSGLGASVYDILMQEVDWLGDDPDELIAMYALVQVYMGAGTSWMDETNTYRFNCVRSAAWWNMRQMLDPKNGYDVMLPRDDTLLGDLIAPKWETKYVHGYLTVCVEPKENLKKPSRLGRSTDAGDAVILAFWEKGSTGGGVVF